MSSWVFHNALFRVLYLGFRIIIRVPADLVSGRVGFYARSKIPVGRVLALWHWVKSGFFITHHFGFCTLCFGGFGLYVIWVPEDLVSGRVGFYLPEVQISCRSGQV